MISIPAEPHFLDGDVDQASSRLSRIHRAPLQRRTASCSTSACFRLSGQQAQLDWQIKRFTRLLIGLIERLRIFHDGYLPLRISLTLNLRFDLSGVPTMRMILRTTL